MMLYRNEYDRDAENSKLVQEYLAQRKRLNTTVKEDVLTVEELEQTLDYESWQEDVEWMRGGC